MDAPMSELEVTWNAFLDRLDTENRLRFGTQVCKLAFYIGYGEGRANP